jgi:hypothetical protein
MWTGCLPIDGHWPEGSDAGRMHASTPGSVLPVAAALCAVEVDTAVVAPDVVRQALSKRPSGRTMPRAARGGLGSISSSLMISTRWYSSSQSGNFPALRIVPVGCGQTDVSLLRRVLPVVLLQCGCPCGFDASASAAEGMSQAAPVFDVWDLADIDRLRSPSSTSMATRHWTGGRGTEDDTLLAREKARSTSGSRLPAFLLLTPPSGAMQPLVETPDMSRLGQCREQAGTGGGSPDRGGQGRLRTDADGHLQREEGQQQRAEDGRGARPQPEQQQQTEYQLRRG